MLLKCPCGALHNPNTRWTYVVYEGTSMNCAEIGPRLGAGYCPMCRRPPVRIERNPPPSYVGPM